MFDLTRADPAWPREIFLDVLERIGRREEIELVLGLSNEIPGVASPSRSTSPRLMSLW